MLKLDNADSVAATLPPTYTQGAQMRTDTLSSQRPSRSLLIGIGAAVVIGAALLALSLFLAGPASDPSSPAADAVQTSEGGEVTVKATWLADREDPSFAIALDTHSVALDG